MLEKRAQILLKTLIERYIAEGQPVGSRTLSRYAGLDVSPATIRNVMADLEEMGFVASPHTSAGRVPTPQGYRFFVDTLLVVKPVESETLDRLQGELSPVEPHRAIQAASQLLSQLTRFAGVVTTPRRRSLTFRQIEFLRLSDTRVLLIVVTPEGDVQNRILVTERSYSAAELSAAAAFLNEHFSGQSFEEIRQRLREELRDLRRDMIALLTAAVDAGREAVAEESGACVVSGETNLLAVEDLSHDLTRLRQLFELLEQKSGILRILEAALQSEGVKVFIGGESGVSAPDDVSVVTSAYSINGEIVGAVGVIGPTRMAYDRIVPIVDVTAKLLSSALSQS